MNASDWISAIELFKVVLYCCNLKLLLYKIIIRVCFYPLISIIIVSIRTASTSLSLWFTGDWQEQFEFWWKFVFCVKSIWEIDSSDSAVSMNLYSQGFNIVGTISSSGEIGQVELNLVPSLIKSHGHCADERLYSGCWLVVWCSESTSNVLVI